MPTLSRPGTSDSTARSRSKDKDNEHRKERSLAPAVQDARSLQRTDTIESTATAGLAGGAAAVAHRDLKKGVKAVSFLSRLMGSSKKKEASEEAIDDEEASNEDRPEGMDARVFAQSVTDNLGFSPRYPQPPAYIKVRSKHKKKREFDRLFLAQELDCRKKPRLDRRNSSNKLRRKSSVAPDSEDTVWAMEFSKDGKYLAAAGADTVVRVWAVLSSLEDRQKLEREETKENEANGAGGHAEHLSAPVFHSRPIREYEGHTATVLDLSWSKNNFLLSSSMDKTVRLWHVSRSECLCTFKHNDFVPSISFHPKDDRFFLAGSLDSRLRLWSIPDKSVAYVAQVPDMITAVAFTPDGKFAMAGCLSGLCMFYETEGLKYQTQIHVRSTRGQNARGSKITGIHAHHTSNGDTKLLITSNDSRIRWYNFRDKSLELKFKGNVNNSSQIRATLSDCGRYVACGSEDRKAYIWSLCPEEGEKRDRRPVEMFEAHDTITTAVCVAPTKTRQLLGKSEDPVYDLCNPPPVTLMSRAERADSQHSSRAPTENGSLRATPTETEGKFERPQPSPAYLARCTHQEGNILVTADFTGRIKVFRQDCAWSKRGRPAQEEWDRASLFGRRTGGRASRTGSLATKGSQMSLKDGAASATSVTLAGPGHAERILSWRQGIASTPSLNRARRSSSKHTNRSLSPRKSLEHKSSKAELATVNGSGDTGAQAKTSPPLSVTPTNVPLTVKPQQPNSRDINPLMIVGGQANVFWDPEKYRETAEHLRQQRELANGSAQQHSSHHHHPHHHYNSLAPVQSIDEPQPADGGDSNHLAVRPSLHNVSGQSYVSRLSDDRSSTSSSVAGGYDDAPERRDEQQEEVKCRACGAKSFSARRVGSEVKLACEGCGRVATS